MCGKIDYEFRKQINKNRERIKMIYNKDGIVEAETKKEMLQELLQYGLVNGTAQHLEWCKELISESETFDYEQRMKGETIKLLHK